MALVQSVSGYAVHSANSNSRRMNLKDEVASYIRDLIFTGEIAPGQKINQEQIATTLGVSKLPVREALISLEAEALITNVVRRGAFVADLTRDDIRDHYAIYGLLAGMAAEGAITRLSAEELDELQAILRAMSSCEDPEQQEKYNAAFHGIINRAGASRRLRSALRQFSRAIPTGFFIHTAGWSERAHKDHEAILTALVDGDGRLASHLVASHLRRSGDYAVVMLEKRGFWPAPQDPDPT